MVTSRDIGRLALYRFQGVSTWRREGAREGGRTGRNSAGGGI